MCGIAGYYLWEERPTPSLAKALELLRHRGPDAAQSWQAPNQHIGLAHTRLSILDLSEAAHQPFQLGPTWLAYNGEIYNFRALIQEGRFSPRTRSDTEVILWAYQKWGESFVEKLEGMFAFALYDAERRTLLLARDPFGIKPLWTAVLKEGIFFASELKVLKSWLAGLQVRPEAVAEFLHLGFIPAPLSWYEGVYKVLPGELWRITPKGFSRRLYYDRTLLWSAPKAPLSYKEAVEAVEAELSRAVRDHLVSDVPIGLFLSGGTDSSLIAALAAAQDHTLQAFAIGFPEATHNELPYAQAVAQHLGLSLEYEILSPQEALKLLPEMARWYDEPFGDVSAIPTYLVSRLAARHVKVVLAGDGGDELYWGYGRYRWAARVALMPLFWRFSASFLKLSPSSRYKRVGELLRLPTQGLVEHIFSQEQYGFSWKEVRQLLPEAQQPWQTPHTLPEDPSEAQAAWDFLHYLPDDLLTKVDRASMQHSLEVRVPFLDKRLVALAWQLPNAYKAPRPQKEIQYKPLLREILKKYLPPPLVERKKWGFTIPLAQWLKGPLKEWAFTYAEPQLLYKSYGISPVQVRRLWKRFERGESYLATRLWLLAQIGAAADNHP